MNYLKMIKTVLVKVKKSKNILKTLKDDQHLLLLLK